jgi:hypothetical protein
VAGASPESLLFGKHGAAEIIAENEAFPSMTLLDERRKTINIAAVCTIDRR